MRKLKIEIIKEPPFFGPNYAKDSLKGLILSIDENAPRKPESYAVKKETLIRALQEKGDIIALGWWEEHFWPSKEQWLYFPKEFCQEVDNCGKA